MSLFPAYAPSTSSVVNTPPVSISESVAGSSTKDWFRFSSFKPPQEIDQPEIVYVDEQETSKPKAPSDNEVEIIDGSEIKSSYSRRKRKDRKRKRRHSSSSSSTSDRSEKSSNRKQVSSRSSAIRATTSAETSLKWHLLKSKPDVFKKDEPLFTLDKNRDIENVQFGTMHKYHLAKFFNHYGHCLGSKSHRGNDDGKMSRYFSKKSQRKLLEKPNVGLFRNRLVQGQDMVLPDFLPLDNKVVIDGEDYIYDSKLQMFRRFHTGQTSTNDEAIEDEADYDISSENRRLNLKIAENPHDIRLWREFLRLQDRLFRERQHNDPNEEKLSTVAALMDRKMSVVEKAIKENPTNVELKLIRLHIARELGWDTARLRDEWRRLEFMHINNPTMWIGRLQFERGGDFSSFSVSRQITIFDHCLERFSTVLSGQLVTHPPPPHGERYFVDFLLAKIRFLFDSGHMEQGIACVQALLEFNFKCPPSLASLSLKEKRQYFEPFWDSNQPRLGDENALGWAETVKRNFQPTDKDDELPAEEDEICRKNSSFRDAGLWLLLERHRESRHWLPWRNMQEPDDPQRIIFYDDIVGILYPIGEPANRFYLVTGLLSLCGMILPSLHSSNKTVWYNEQLAFDALRIFNVLPQLHRPNLFRIDQFIQQLCSEADECFMGSSTYSLFLMYGQIEHGAASLITADLPQKEKLKRYRRIGKSQLDDDRWRDQLPLYVAYANGLMKLGAYVEACTIAETALSNTNSTFVNANNLIEKLSILNLVIVWIEGSLFEASSRSATSFVADKLGAWLSTYSWPKESSASSKANLLKGKKALSEQLTLWISQTNFQSNDEPFLTSWMGSIGSLLSHIACIFNYVCTGNLDDSKRFYDEMRQYLKTCMTEQSQSTMESLEKDLERLWTWEIRLMDYHLRSNPSAPPRILNQCLEDALGDFSSNAEFLKRYVDRHLSGQLFTKLRRFFDHRHDYLADNGDASRNLEISWIAAIYAEFARYIKLKDEQSDDVFGSGFIPDTNRLRNVLVKAAEACPNCVFLWRLRLTLESYLGEREFLKRSFYLAIRQCPWAKDLYMDAISYLPDEGQSIVDLMLEKGLRVRVPWEEFQLLRRANERRDESKADDN